MVNSPDRWPAASTLLASSSRPDRIAIKLLGAHTYRTSVTPRSAASTPVAVRAALSRYSTYVFDEDIDLADEVIIVDHGDLEEADLDVEGQLEALLVSGDEPWLLLGGDNAITWRAMRALAAGELGRWGLITLDAHLDMREGVSNGSPVRQLLDEGLDGNHVVQIGLADFSNSAHYAAEARHRGVTIIPRSQLRSSDLMGVLKDALAIAGAGGRPVYVDIDVDVCDRSVVPGCPAAAPGGLSADELRVAVRCLARDARVRAIDFTEIDLERDTADERTVRLAALLLLEAAAGIARRIP